MRILTINISGSRLKVHSFFISVLMRIFGVHPDLKVYTGNVRVCSYFIIIFICFDEKVHSSSSMKSDDVMCVY